VTNSVVDGGAFDSDSWSFTNNPITDFFGYLVSSVTSVFQTSGLPFDQAGTSQALYLAEGNTPQGEFLIASGLYAGEDGGAPYMQTDFNGTIFNETTTQSTLQRYDGTIGDDDVDANGDGVNVTASLDPSHDDPISLWKQMTVTTR
jgi:hypothetical protein